MPYSKLRNTALCSEFMLDSRKLKEENVTKWLGIWLLCSGFQLQNHFVLVASICPEQGTLIDPWFGGHGKLSVPSEVLAHTLLDVKEHHRLSFGCLKRVGESSIVTIDRMSKYVTASRTRVGQE